MKRSHRNRPSSYARASSSNEPGSSRSKIRSTPTSEKKTGEVARKCPTARDHSQRPRYTQAHGFNADRVHQRRIRGGFFPPPSVRECVFTTERHAFVMHVGSG